MNALTTILIIDDDEAEHYLCEAVFRRASQEVTILKAYDGEEAIGILSGDHPPIDLILLDINMPRMNGHEFLAAYNQMSPGEIPVVAMLTSSDQDRDRDNTAKYPFVRDYQIKPLSKDSIRSLLKIVEGTRQRLGE